MNVLIVYGTTEGQTRKVAEFLCSEAKKLGHRVDIADATNHPPLPNGYDVVLIGASFHMGKYQSAIAHYVKQNVETLNKMTSGLFSLSLAVVSKDEASMKELEEHTRKFLNETGWKPVDIEQVAGALLYTHYDFFKKMMMRMIAKHEGRSTDTSSDYEYTDWMAVKGFLERMLKV